MNEQDTLQVDVLIVGAGPAGIACAIKLAQHNAQSTSPLSIMVIEKAASLGAHSLSGAIFDASVLDNLLPNWRANGAPILAPVGEEQFLWLTKKSFFKLPIIASLKNHGNSLISLSQFMPWFGAQAEQLGVDVLCGFSAAEIIYDKQAVIGIRTGAKGDAVPSMVIKAKHTLIAEGARGYLAEQLIDRFDLRKHADPQSYALGVKEIWQVPKGKLTPGKVVHTTGYPLTGDVYGGGFIYHLSDTRVAVGQVIGLDYSNPTLDPSQELQRFKQHPYVSSLLNKGQCIGYGARTLNEGGWQALPQCAFPGGLLLGCAAGTLNVGEMKGIHHAMRTGMLAADTILTTNASNQNRLSDFDAALRKSSAGIALQKSRNIRPSFARFGRIGGFIYSAIDQMIFRGKAPWTLSMPQADHQSLKPLKKVQKIIYPKPDGQLILSKADLLFHSGVYHQEGAKSHLIAKDHTLHKENNAVYGTPELFYCPADVYQMIEKDGQLCFTIQSKNCLHCKACDIKNVHQNIKWTPPQGGDGPNYRDM